jgi:membrane fusion protein, heavy metal efflux system
MKNLYLTTAVLLLCAGTVSCNHESKPDPSQEAPPAEKVAQVGNPNIVRVENPQRFALVVASSVEDVPEINVTGTVNPDVSLSIPVVSLASGRVVEIDAKLGDDVKKGQLLLKILSNDIASALQTYNQARADAALAEKQLDRAKLLYDHGAISLNDLQVAENAAEKAKVAVDTSRQQVQTLGGSVDHPNTVIDVYAPASGTIVEQNVVQSSNVHTPDNQPNLFTIANLSRVWVICDVYENDLPAVRLGDRADIRLDAYPDETLKGTVSNIGAILDPNLRTAKVRVALPNNGHMRAGMFVKATFHGLHGRAYAAVPPTAILHLHDRDWVFVPHNNQEFERLEVTGGNTANGLQQVRTGISPGQQVVKDALSLESESEQ